MTIIEYITEEVERQGHNTRTAQGVWRVVWMLDAWKYMQWQVGSDFIIDDIELLGKLVEPAKNKDGFRQCQVFVGGHIPPPPKEIRERLERWYDLRKQMTAIEAYKEFEIIHPFVDGNGRVGKIILNWLNMTLHAPIFPPKDLWGHPIANP